MAISKVTIEDGCIVCGVCETVCPEVFKVNDTAVVLKEADLAANEAKIKEAAASCPVTVIKVE
jgi:ferredoxin